MTADNTAAPADHLGRHEITDMGVVRIPHVGSRELRASCRPSVAELAQHRFAKQIDDMQPVIQFRASWEI